MITIPEKLQGLLTDEKKAFVYLATLMNVGTPQVTPVWFNTDGEYIIINSAAGCIKDKNMLARINVDALAFKYLGKEKYPKRKPNEQRVTYKILPLNVDAY